MLRVGRKTTRSARRRQLPARRMIRGPSATRRGWARDEMVQCCEAVQWGDVKSTRYPLFLPDFGMRGVHWWCHRPAFMMHGDGCGCAQGPRKSVRLVRIFLDKYKSCGQFWSETTSETNRQTVNGHFIACPCHRQLSIVWINSLSVDKFTFFWQLSIIRTNVHGMDNCSYYFITCLCHRHKTCFFVATLTK